MAVMDSMEDTIDKEAMDFLEVQLMGLVIAQVSEIE